MRVSREEALQLEVFTLRREIVRREVADIDRAFAEFAMSLRFTHAIPEDAEFTINPDGTIEVSSTPPAPARPAPPRSG